MDKKPLKEGKGPYLRGIKAIIFDGGGTIWDSSDGIYESYAWGFKQLGLPFSLAPGICHRLRGLRDFNTALGIAKALLWASGALGNKDDLLFLERKKANEYLREKVENLQREKTSFLPLATELTGHFDEYLYKKVRDETYPLVPYAAEILEKIDGAGYQLALVTIRRSGSVDRILSHYGLKGYFPNILSTEGLGEGEKTVSIAREALKHLTISPSQVLWVGDSGVDMSCAKGAGTFAVGILTGLANRQTLLDEGADWIVDDLRGLADLLGIDHYL
jgi:phosphoglycolate phosphatase-like HAD superfamily hydrolase